MNAECRGNVHTSCFGHASHVFSNLFANLKCIFAAFIEKYKHGFTSCPLTNNYTIIYMSKERLLRWKKWLRTVGFKGKPLACWCAATVTARKRYGIETSVPKLLIRHYLHILCGLQASTTNIYQYALPWSGLREHCTKRVPFKCATFLFKKWEVNHKLCICLFSQSSGNTCAKVKKTATNGEMLFTKFYNM